MKKFKAIPINGDENYTVEADEAKVRYSSDSLPTLRFTTEDVVTAEFFCNQLVGWSEDGPK